MDVNSQNFTVKEILLEHVRDTADSFKKLENRLDIVALDHETRIRTLEKQKFSISGAWGAVGVLGAFIAGAGGLILGVLSIYT